MQGLEDDPEYKLILEYLEKRGHPLFNRIRVQILDRKPIDAVMSDTRESYLSAVTDPTYRVKGPLCKFCAYKPLCDIDYFDPDNGTREMAMTQIENS